MAMVTKTTNYPGTLLLNLNLNRKDKVVSGQKQREFISADICLIFVNSCIWGMFLHLQGLFGPIRIFLVSRDANPASKNMANLD